MSEINKNYTGKVVRMEFTRDGRPQNVVGYVYDQKEVAAYRGMCTEFSMCLTNGNDWNPRFYPDSDLKISSVRMDKDLRDALKAYGDAKVAQTAFLKRFEEQKGVHAKAVDAARQAVRGVSKDMSATDMMRAVEALFDKAFPCTGGHSSQYFHCTSCGSKDITMTQIRDVEKYATPEKYPFLYRQYDQTLRIYYDSKEFNAFCQKNAPAVVPALKGFKNSVDGSIGDKNWLTVSRSYEIPLTHGLTKDSLEDIKAFLDGRGKKPSLADQIQSAGSKKSAIDSKTKKSERDR